MIAIIDYQAGNPHSVANALDHLGYSAVLVTKPSELDDKKLIILPGVGSASATKESLTELGLWEALPDHVLSKKTPFLGICVGMQVLFEYSEEEDTPCWGWLPGRVRHYDKRRVRVPQMGWNALRYNPEHPLYSRFHQESDHPYFYFVNSYYADPAHRGDILGLTDYDGEFCSMVNRENIFAVQFHIEKSGQAGMRLFRNILDLLGIESKSVLVK